MVQRGRYLVILCTVVGASAASMSLAHGQSREDSVNALALFEEGRSLMALANYDGARAKFEASIALIPNPGASMNLGVCYRQLGKAASAWSAFREAHTIAEANGRAEMAAEAKAAAQELEGDLSSIVIHGDKLSANPDFMRVVTISRNDKTIDPRLFGQVIFVDPGPQRVEVVAPGYQTYSRVLRVSPGERQSVALPAPRPESTADSQDNASAGDAQNRITDAILNPPPGRHHPVRHALGIVVMSAGASALVSSLGLGWSSGQTRDRAFASGDCSVSTSLCTSGGQATMDSARRQATLANLAAGTGALLIGAGVVLYLSASWGKAGEADKPGSATATIAPVLTGDGAGLTLTGRF